ncbi:MAG TPA: uracil-DNA glycosylase [Usitatibacter sp.]|nr:uracil-DNA glycosylase [Usitatibacter sp.]
MSDASEFLRFLERGPTDSRNVFNPWRDHDERDRVPRRAMPGRRRDNMQAYIEARSRTARVLLLGEAPSHRGCRFTGIAFCSEVELTHKADIVARRPLELTSVDCEKKPMRERSAAVIWGELERAGCAREVVLWNAFPWHPYGETVTSNRKPRNKEVEEGRDALRALLRCFTHELEIFAVGKVAEQALGRWEEAECAGYIRHPAQGGEAKFRSQFRELVLPRL